MASSSVSIPDVTTTTVSGTGVRERSRARSRPRRLPIPILKATSQPQIMVVESPALVLAFLSKKNNGSKSNQNPTANSDARPRDPSIPEAASYMNNSLTDDDMFISKTTVRQKTAAAAQYNSYRMKTISQLKETAHGARRSTSIMDRFEKKSLPKASADQTNSSKTTMKNDSKVYEDGMKQFIQIYPAPAVSSLLTPAKPDARETSSSSSKSSSVTATTTSTTKTTTPAFLSVQDTNANTALPGSPKPPTIQYATRPKHRTTSSPLILYAAPLEYLFLLQLYRISQSQFHDKTVTTTVQLERAAALLYLLTEQRREKDKEDRLSIATVRGMVDTWGVVDRVLLSPSDQDPTGCSTSTSSTSSSVKWADDRGPNGLEVVVKRVNACFEKKYPAAAQDGLISFG